MMPSLLPPSLVASATDDLGAAGQRAGGVAEHPGGDEHGGVEPGRDRRPAQLADREPVPVGGDQGQRVLVDLHPDAGQRGQRVVPARGDGHLADGARRTRRRRRSPWSPACRQRRVLLGGQQHQGERGAAALDGRPGPVGGEVDRLGGQATARSRRAACPRPAPCRARRPAPGSSTGRRPRSRRWTGLARCPPAGACRPARVPWGAPGARGRSMRRPLRVGHAQPGASRDASCRCRRLMFAVSRVERGIWHVARWRRPLGVSPAGSATYLFLGFFSYK